MIFQVLMRIICYSLTSIKATISKSL